MICLCQDEFEKMETKSFIPWDSFTGKTFFITGATGLIGRTLVETLLEYRRLSGNSMRVLALVRNAERARALLGELGSSLAFVEGSVEALPDIAESVDYILHCACPTGSAFFAERPVETMHIIIEGTRRVLELARKKQVCGMVYLSSMEVYGQVTHGEKLSEEMLGYVDLMSARSSYPVGKRVAECLCHNYAAEYGVPVRIARLAQTFGAGVDSNDGRVFAYMARCALRGENILLKTDGSKRNPYLYTTDAVSAILGLLEKGTSGDVYNVANEATYCSVKEMAELVAQTLGGGEISVKTGTDNSGKLYPPAGCLDMSTEKLRLLGWRPQTDLAKMYRRMVEGFKENKGSGI